MQNSWFALHTRHQHEAKVSLILNRKGFETFLPVYQTVKRWSDRTKIVSLPLFPGYLFASGIADRRYEVLNTPGVAGIVSTAGTPAVISEEEIDGIRRAVFKPSKVEPHPYLKTGDEICVRCGAMAGTRGFLVRKKDAYRLVVCVEILGRAASVEIDALDVDPLQIPAIHGSDLHVS